MITGLIVTLILFDTALLVAVVYLGRAKVDNEALIADLTEERKYLSDLRNSVQEDLSLMQNQNRELLKKVSTLATEAEMEVRSGGDSLAKEVEGIVETASKQFDQPLKQLTLKQSAVEKTIRKSERERQLLVKAIQRGESLLQFFDKKLPYSEVVEGIRERKYTDARAMLAKGFKPDAVAQELGLSPSEVHLIADFS